MDNLVLETPKHFDCSHGEPILTSYESSASLLLVLDCSLVLHYYNYDPKTDAVTLTAKTPPIPQFQGQKVILLAYLVEQDAVLAVLQAGSIFTISKDFCVESQAENQDGIAAASVSPTQEYLYLATNNHTIAQLNMQFDLVNQVPIDTEQQGQSNENPRFSWRADGSFFVLNYAAGTGRRAVTRDSMMKIHMSPSRSDPEGGLVQCVGETKSMSHLVAWQPSASLIAGCDRVVREGRSIERVIFWEKNGLRHLEFELGNEVELISGLTWSADSDILYVEATELKERKLLLYTRANYHWYLKAVIPLEPHHHYIVTKYKSAHKILLLGKGGGDIIIVTKKLSPARFHADDTQGASWHYSIDGHFLLLTDYSKCVLPPPMAAVKLEFSSNILGVSLLDCWILILTEQSVQIYGTKTNEMMVEVESPFKRMVVGDVALVSEETMAVNGRNYCLKGLAAGEQTRKGQNVYTAGQQYRYELEQGKLKVNGVLLSQECTSFCFYRRFLLLTTNSTDMYDRLYVIPLAYHSLTEHSLRYLAENESLSHRMVERGSLIMCVTKGKCIFQLPRGNLETIYPKVMAIADVKANIYNNNYLGAFQIIRTNKLDFNLLHDIAPSQFMANITQVLLSLKRVDYLNLLISMTTDAFSSELKYVMSNEELKTIQAVGKSTTTICSLISATLRTMDYDKYILPIFTSDIKAQKLSGVLFEIKELKKKDVTEEVAPHLSLKSKMSCQAILEYVCWLVDPVTIYRESLMTYDLELAAMTARCTQMDPKEYIPYLESLKIITDPVEFRSQICLTQKNYDRAVAELAQGDEHQKTRAVQLVKEKKLFKIGITAFKKQVVWLKEIKLLLVEELLSAGETNEAYNICLAIGEVSKALQIAVKDFQTKRIMHCLRILHPQEQSLKEQVQRLLATHATQDRVELARLFGYVGRYEEAAEIYLKAGMYGYVLAFLSKLPSAFIQTTLVEALILNCSLKKNEILKQKEKLETKLLRLSVVHRGKKESSWSGVSNRNAQNEDMYSEVSQQSSKSNYTISTTTGMRKKKKDKKSILTRNVKEGSALEEEYLLAHINDILAGAPQLLKEAKTLIQHMLYFDQLEAAEQLRNLAREFIEAVNQCKTKSYAQQLFENNHPELLELYPLPDKTELTITAFDYLI